VGDPGKISSTKLIRLAIFFILESFPTPIWLIIMIGLNSCRAAVLGLKFWKQKKKIDVGNQMDMPTKSWKGVSTQKK
jgi:hypothetical protein